MANPGDAVYPTVNEIRAIGTWVQTAGLVSGLDYREPDDQYDLVTSNSMSFSITGPSAQEQCFVVSGSEYAGYTGDLFICHRVPPINKSTCHADVDFLGLYIERRDDVGVYGPADALAHTDWVGTGGVPAPNASGEFTVTDDGILTLTIPSDYENRLDDVPLETAPEGCPVIYLTRRSNWYYPTEPFNEGAYCWLGWVNLEIPITAPEAGSLTLTLVYRTYTFSDNHLSDSTRVTTFSYAYEEETITYNVPVVAGAQTAVVQLIAKDPYPLFERVVSMALSGFDTGGWIIGEPSLAQVEGDSTGLKTFEGYEYYEGGASGHMAAAFEWYDVMGEPNLGSANLAEETVRFFDRITGAGESALDLTTAYMLLAYASILQRVSEVFDCHKNTAACEDALTDDEEPPNTLSPLWGFNICYPNAENPGANPLEQSVD